MNKKTRFFIIFSLIGTLLSACANQKIENYKCEDKMNSLYFKYDKKEGKISFIKVTQGNEVKIIGKIYNAFESEGILIWKIKTDYGYNANAFFNMKEMKLETKDNGEDRLNPALNQTLKCKRI
jgi:hypothetical protein